MNEEHQRLLGPNDGANGKYRYLRCECYQRQVKHDSSIESSVEKKVEIMSVEVLNAYSPHSLHPPPKNYCVGGYS